MNQKTFDVIVAGGGTAYVNAVAAVEKLVSEVEGDEKTGEGHSAVCSRAQSRTGQYFFCMQS